MYLEKAKGKQKREEIIRALASDFFDLHPDDYVRTNGNPSSLRELEVKACELLKALDSAYRAGAKCVRDELC